MIIRICIVFALLGILPFALSAHTYNRDTLQEHSREVPSLRTSDGQVRFSISHENSEDEEESDAILIRLAKNYEECEPPPKVIPPKDDMSSMTLWELLEKTEKDLEIHKGEAVLLVGNTGSGKSTVALTVTGDLKNLTVYETEGGSLIIVDAAQKIGITTASRTLVPELIPDPPNDLFFYDFPGFLDNRAAKADITANYLMKKVTDNLGSLRLALIVPEDSVKVGGIKTDFDQLTTSIIKMIRDLNKMDKSLGMIVTKVGNFDARGRVRENSAIFDGITKFLKQYREDQENRLNQLRSSFLTNDNENANVFVRRSQSHSLWRRVLQAGANDQEAIRSRIKLVDILLQDNKIAILRQPDECGPFDLSTWSQESRDGMTKLMRDELKSVPTTQNDFGFALSSDTIVEVVGLYKELNQNVTDLMTQLVNDLKQAQLESILAIKEFYTVKSWIDADYGNFSSVVDQLKNCRSPAEFGRSMNSAIASRGYDQNWGMRIREETKKIESYMDFFDSTAPDGMTFDRQSAKWLEPLRNWVTSDVAGRKEWYTFIENLRRTVAQSDFQSNRNSSAPQDIGGLKIALGKYGSIVTEKVIELYESNQKVITPEDIEILWEVTKEAFENPIISCQSSKMTVKGSFVLVSQFTDSDGAFTLCQGSTPTQVTVYASRKVFFDRSIAPTKVKDKDPELGIVSPEWEVTDSQSQVQVDLSGIQGQSASRRFRRDLSDGLFPDKWIQSDHSSTSEENESLFSSGQDEVRNISLMAVNANDLPQYIKDFCKDKPKASNGGQGAMGSPGSHGFPGGQFIGLTGHVAGGSRLRISVNGGNGGSGAAGVKGGDGGQGSAFPYSKWRNYDTSGPSNSNCPTKGYECNREGAWPKHYDLCWRQYSDVKTCHVFGCVGGLGGRGGDGGAPGQGGKGGKSFLVVSDGSSGITESLGDGSKGQPGQGGSGGQGGLRGLGTEANVHDTIWGAGIWDDMKYNIQSGQRSQGGSNGVTGVNTQGQAKPRDPSFKLDQVDLFLRFKEFVYSRDSVYFPNQEFIDQIKRSPEFTKHYTHLHLAEELLIVEQANLLLKNRKVPRDVVALQMVPKYASLVSGVDARVHSSDDLSDAKRKFLSLLYSTAFNQLRTLRQVLGTPMVVDVSGYLEAIDRRLEEYSETENKVLVDAERVRYRETFERKIEETMKFIIETVDPSIEETHVALKEVTDQLLVAVDEWIKQMEEAEVAYQAAIKDTKKRMQMQGLFNMLKVGGAVIGLVGGPAGAAVGGIIGGAASIGENVALGGASEIRPPTPLPPSIKKYADKMEAKAKATSPERQDELNVLILEARAAATENVALLYQANVVVDQLENDKKELIDKESTSSLKEFQEMNKKVVQSENDLKELLENSAVFIKKAQSGQAGTPEEQATAKKEGGKALSSLQKINDAVNIVSGLGMDIYNQYKNDKAELARLAAMVEEAKQQVKDLENYEKAVNELLVPFTESVIDDLEKAKEGMAGGSAVFLRVQQWQVGKILRQYNFFLQDFTQAFPDISKQYAFLVDELQEAMTLTIDLYAFIEQYNEQMQFADYIANINSPNGLAAVLGPEEGAIYDKIDLAYQGSLILSEWDTAIQTFEQWVFPFSNEFQGSLLTYNIPDYLAQPINTAAEVFNLLIPDIRRRVTNLVIALQQYKSATFPAIDNDLIHTAFNSDQSSTIPFHVSPWELNQRVIHELLSGRQVTLSIPTDYTYSHEMSAVKFTIAEIEPKARDEKVQVELKSLLDKLRVKMVHSGVSKYLHEGTTYEMVGGRQVIQYNFERDPQGNRLASNNIYKKIASGDVILSPYTVWTAQLLKAHENIEFDFEELAKLTRFVDLELIGKGSFVRKKEDAVYTIAAFHAMPLHYFRFRLSSLPLLRTNSAFRNLISQR